MDNLYIKIENDQTVGNPLTGENLILHYGEIPSEYQPFIRLPIPDLGVYEVLINDNPDYLKVNGVWTDVWSTRTMTDEEKKVVQQRAHDKWNLWPKPHFESWTFNEETCRYEAPIPMPTDENDYFWQETQGKWTILPPYPDDGNAYIIDKVNAVWVLKT